MCLPSGFFVYLFLGLDLCYVIQYLSVGKRRPYLFLTLILNLFLWHNLYILSISCLKLGISKNRLSSDVVLYITVSDSLIPINHGRMQAFSKGVNAPSLTLLYN